MHIGPVEVNLISAGFFMESEDIMRMIETPKTVGELKTILNNYDDDMLVAGMRWVNRWSGDPNDTDLSGYEDCELLVIDGSFAVPFEKDDPRMYDKRRTNFFDSYKCLKFVGQGSNE